MQFPWVTCFFITVNTVQEFILSRAHVFRLAARISKEQCGLNYSQNDAPHTTAWITFSKKKAVQTHLFGLFKQHFIRIIENNKNVTYIILYRHAFSLNKQIQGLVKLLTLGLKGTSSGALAVCVGCFLGKGFGALSSSQEALGQTHHTLESLYLSQFCILLDELEEVAS